MIYNSRDCFKGFFNTVKHSLGIKKQVYLVLGFQLVLLISEIGRFIRFDKELSYQGIIQEYSNEVPDFFFLVQGVLAVVLILLYRKIHRAWIAGIEVNSNVFHLYKNGKLLEKMMDHKLNRIVLELNNKMITFEFEKEFPVIFSTEVRNDLIRDILKENPKLKDKFFQRNRRKDPQLGYYKTVNIEEFQD